MSKYVIKEVNIARQKKSLRVCSDLQTWSWKTGNSPCGDSWQKCSQRRIRRGKRPIPSLQLS